MIELPEAVKKYLDKYSLSEWRLEWNENKNITHVIVVPAISEFGYIQKLLSSLSQNNSEYLKNTLIIFVVNNSANSSSEIKIDNSKTISYLKNKIDTTNDSGLQIGIMDAASSGNGLPNKTAGVGLARKIGMDYALRIFNYSNSQKKIITCLDADCTVKRNYITEIVESFNNKKLSAAVVNFSHNISGEDENSKAIICYEIFLRYYVLGLKFANSHYAFHAIGSTMICDFESYIKVEGMNKKKAAEDFYFLEKLAKNFSITKINTTTVYPSSRESLRVPFGTGQRVNRFLSKAQNEYLLYNPKSFKVLKEWLEIFHSSETHSSDYYLSESKKINKSLHDFLISQNFNKRAENIMTNSTSLEQLKKQKLVWFDGFMTLKLIHFLRDNGFPLINMFDALDEMFTNFNQKNIYRKNKSELPDLEIQKKYLNVLRIIA